MHRILEYTMFFIVLLLLQGFLFNNLNISVFVNPLVYIAFIVLLPMEALPVAVLMLGLMTGVAADFLTGGAGLHTIATLATAFFRLPLMTLMVGKELVHEGGVPSPERLGVLKFLRYTLVISLLHCIVYFGFESLSYGVGYFHLTLLKILFSTLGTVLLIFFARMLLPATHLKRSRA